MMMKVYDNYIICFSEKQNPYQNACTYFCHVTLIISNEKFQFQSQSECENLKYLLLALSFQKLEVGACPHALNVIGLDQFFAV